MAEGRDTMIGMGVGAPALGGEERSDEAPRAGVAERSRAPDPEVVAKPTRRRFTAAYKLRILEETDGCSEPAEVCPCPTSTALNMIGPLRYRAWHGGSDSSCAAFAGRSPVGFAMCWTERVREGTGAWAR